MGLIDFLMFNMKLRAIKRLVQEGRSLDVGCGDKRYTVHLPSPIGVDPYTEYDSHINQPDYVMDARDLKFPDHTFDNVCLFDTLEHIPEADIAVKEAWRVLRSNGILAITDPNDRWLFWARLLCGRVGDAYRGRKTPRKEDEKSPDHIHHFNEEKLMDLTSPLFKLEKKIPRIIFTGYRFRKVMT